jgi:hypothetical protein
MGRHNRHQPVISRQSDESFQEDHWLNRFQQSLSKNAVQPKRESLFDQINSIMNKKSKYPSVEAAVRDMQERSGLTAYLNSLEKTSEKEEIAPTKKVASNQNLPVVIQKNPEILKTIENYIRDSKGNLPVPAIIDKVQAIHRSDVPDAKDWDDNKLIMLVSKLNLGAKSNNPTNYENYSNLGTRDKGAETEIDPSNTDAFHALTPAKI